ASDTDQDEKIPCPSSGGSQRRRIQRQIEFYLSDANLSRDKFFAQQMKNREDEGIPIELLLNCHRLQMLQATEELVIRAVKKSTLLHLSSDGKAIVRSQPVSTLPAREKRTVLVVGIPRWSTEPPQPPAEYCADPDETCPEPKSSDLCLATWQVTDWLRDVFSEFGQVLYVQLPQFQSSGFFRGFAFIEFADSKEAKAATNAFRPSAANQQWFVPPCGSNVSGRIPCPEHAWKPRLAAKATFAEEDMLARRYIWRCCSRKNKQIQSAMRQLRNAGYRAPNPFNREYELITIGEFSAEARQKHLSDLFGTPHKEKLCVFRYTTWQFWRSKFYEWHRLWIERMRLKTDELSIDPDSVPLTTEDAVSPRAINPALPNSVKGDCTIPHPTIPLPRDFVPGTVVQVIWPSSLVSGPDANPTNSELGPLLPPPRVPSLARRIRISLEHYLLASNNLLDQVAHVDPTPSDQVVRHVKNAEVETKEDHVVCSVESTASYPVFIRFKTKVAAKQLIEFTEQSQSEMDDCSRKPPPTCLSAHILSSKAEEAYCHTVAASLVGSHERRRRIQQNRRQRIRHQKGGHLSVSDEPMETSNPASTSGTVSNSQVNIRRTSPSSTADPIGFHA
ncbi:La protein 7, partial [Fasciola gigantica]